MQDEKEIINPQMVLEIIRRYTRLHDKKTRTHGGEYCGPCPRCERLYGDGGEDRFLVWPMRPLVGGTLRQDPVFMCRQCRRSDGTGKPWSGDLCQFLQDVADMSYGQARAEIGYPLSGRAEGQTRVWQPYSRGLDQPSQEYQVACFRFIEECEARLWSEEGQEPRQYLLDTRGLTEKVIREARLGCVTDLERFDRAKQWALSGNGVRIPRGIVFPELHNNGTECWSVSIRRPPQDLEDEELETGEKAHKYHMIRGGNKGLYGADYVYDDQPCVLVEGQLDQLTVLQEGQGYYGAAATQSTTGARHEHWITLLSKPSMVFLCQDPDEAGESSLQWWQKRIMNSLPWRPTFTDINGLLMSGQDVVGFLRQGERKFWGIEAPQIIVETPVSQEIIHDIPEIAKPQILTTELNKGIPAQEFSENEEDYWSKGCFECGGDVEQVHVGEGGRIWLYCVKHQMDLEGDRCYRCNAKAEYQDNPTGHYWCSKCYTAKLLVEFCAECKWTAMSIDQTGFYVVSKDFCEVEGFRVPPGRSAVLEFARTCTRDELQLAWQKAYRVKNGEKAISNNTYAVQPKKVIRQHCSAVGCGMEAAREAGGKNVLGLHFCSRCFIRWRLLSLGLRLDFPAHRLAAMKVIDEGGQKKYRYMKDGQEDWVDWAIKASIFECTFAHDWVTRKEDEVLAGKW